MNQSRCTLRPGVDDEAGRESWMRLPADISAPVVAAQFMLKLLACILALSACNLSRPAPPTPPPSATPAIPQVRILYPPHNQRVIEGVIFDIDILASDPAKGVARVELYVDEALLQTSDAETGSQQTYRITTNWLARGTGWHKFSAIAYRADGTASHPHIIALEVVPPS